jgi:hypothetical protein
MDVEITEFEEIDPAEVHLVKRGANGFPPLLAKQVAEEIAAAEAGEDLAEKSTLSTKDRNSMDESDFAYVDATGGKHLPIHDAPHVRAALGRFGATKFDTPADRKQAAQAILAAAKKFGISVSADTDVTAAAKSVPIVSGPNPLVGAVSPADASVPGSPTWEAADADTAAQAAAALMQAADLIRTFAGREGAEVAAGAGSDLIDEFDALSALDAVTCALGIMARLAFLEGAEAQKAVTKAGKVLSAKNVDAIRAAIQALEDILTSAAGGSTNTDGEGAAEKAQEDNLAMTRDDVIALLDELKSARKAARSAKKARKAAKKAQADENMTDEERAAQAAAAAEKKAAKAAVKTAKTAAKESAATPVTVDDIRETVVKGIDEMLRPILDRLATVEKMAAPGGPVKTRTPGALHKSEERDRLELAAAEFVRKADATSDTALRQGYLEKAKSVQAQIAALTA